MRAAMTHTLVMQKVRLVEVTGVENLPSRVTLSAAKSLCYNLLRVGGCDETGVVTVRKWCLERLMQLSLIHI